MAQPTSTPIRFAVVDDDLRAVQSLSSSLQWATAYDFLACILPRAFPECAPVRKVDLILIQSRMGQERVRELTRRFTQSSHNEAAIPKVVILGVEGDSADLAQFIEAGATSYVPTDAPLGELISIGRSAVNGQTNCPPHVAFGIFERLTELSREKAASQWIRKKGLTPRELDILRMLARRLNNEQIASGFCLSVATVKSHVHRILSKLEVRSRMEAAACFTAVTNA